MTTSCNKNHDNRPVYNAGRISTLIGPRATEGQTAQISKEQEEVTAGFLMTELTTSNAIVLSATLPLKYMCHCKVTNSTY